MNVETQIFRGHRSNTSEKDAPGPQTPIFIVFCDLHLYIKTQLLEKFSSRGVKNGPFSDLPLAGSGTITTTHIFRDTTDHTFRTHKTSKYLFLQCEIDTASGVTLRWLVG